MGSRGAGCRIRLQFDDDFGAVLPDFETRFLFVVPTRARLVSDVMHAISDRFGLSNSSVAPKGITLQVDGFSLLPDEYVACFHENDTVRILKRTFKRKQVNFNINTPVKKSKLVKSGLACVKGKSGQASSKKNKTNPKKRKASTNTSTKQTQTTVKKKRIQQTRKPETPTRVSSSDEDSSSDSDSESDDSDDSDSDDSDDDSDSDDSDSGYDSDSDGTSNSDKNDCSSSSSSKVSPAVLLQPVTSTSVTKIENKPQPSKLPDASPDPSKSSNQKNVSAPAKHVRFDGSSAPHAPLVLNLGPSSGVPQRRKVQNYQRQGHTVNHPTSLVSNHGIKMRRKYMPGQGEESNFFAPRYRPRDNEDNYRRDGSMRSQQSDEKSYESELILTIHPQAGDIIAFRMIELVEWTPTTSKYKVAKIVAFSPTTKIVRLKNWSISNPHNVESKTSEVPYSEMLEIRIMGGPSKSAQQKINEKKTTDAPSVPATVSTAKPANAANSVPTNVPSSVPTSVPTSVLTSVPTGVPTSVSTSAASDPIQENACTPTSEDVPSAMIKTTSGSETSPIRDVKLNPEASSSDPQSSLECPVKSESTSPTSSTSATSITPAAPTSVTSPSPTANTSVVAGRATSAAKSPSSKLQTGVSSPPQQTRLLSDSSTTKSEDPKRDDAKLESADPQATTSTSSSSSNPPKDRRPRRLEVSYLLGLLRKEESK